MKKYYPILISKKGEIIALQHLKQTTKDAICPVIEIVDDSLEKKVKEKNGSYKIVYKDELENFLKTHWCFFGNEIILDFSLISNIETKVELIRKMIVSMIRSGVNIVPAIHIKMATVFADMIKALTNEFNLNVCLRTSEKSDGFDQFKIATEKLTGYFNIELKRISLLLDIGYAKYDRYNSLRDLATNAIKSLNQKVPEWNNVIVASSSFPENLGEFKILNNPNKIKRYEWEIWKKMKIDEDLNGIQYGDFGTKFPYFTEANFAGTISIKYTIENDFLIYKGELTTEHEHGHRQYISHASKLIKSEDYYGKDFSWGDKRIFEMASQDHTKETSHPGSPTIWVQISQNHHIELINTLL